MDDTSIKPLKPATKAVAYALYPEDEATVDAVAKRNGSSASQAVRFIIRDWARENMPKPATPDEAA